MSRIRCVIIEDELPAVEDLKYIISAHQLFEVIGTAQDAISGYSLIVKTVPDLIFLDINIPGQNGIELAKRIRNSGFKSAVVFVTAYEQHALQAFEVQAVDYILKPFDEKRIYSTMNRLFESLKNKKTNGDNNSFSDIKEILCRIEQNSKTVKRIPCDISGRTNLINTDDICFCCIIDEKTYVKTRERKTLTHFTLNELEKKTDFFRTHKSYIVNLNHIKELYPWFNGAYELVMDDVEKSKVPLSRNYVKKLKDVLGQK